MAKPAQAHRNRLADEPSPYLRQHAGNPVDWWPWGEEAFAEARRRDVPVFLSIGYATCHWCHVMAHESFEDGEAARRLNEAFVCVKVDREERPDVDGVHMAVCQMMTGSGGWPLTVLLTPDRRPFFAGTYFPKESRHGRIGVMDLAAQVSELWRTRRDDLVRQAESVVGHLAHAQAKAGGRAELGPGTLDAAFARLRGSFDRTHGGFGGPPKFPSPHQVLFLLRQSLRGETEARDMAIATLRAIAAGGIHDHLGGGFHRYATDAEWRLPHFEKMLYDQAMLAMAFTEAWQATGEADLQAAARDALDYVLRDLRDPAGGFRCAEDADSEGEEGRFYVWTRDGIRAVLGPAEGDLFCRAYGVRPEGNFRDEATRRRTGANVLHLPQPLVDFAKNEGTTLPELERRLADARAKLVAARAKRERPLLDDKAIVDWNGLAVAAFAKAGAAFDEPRYTQAAREAATFAWKHMRGPDGHLLHMFHHGKTRGTGLLDDHAFLLWGLVELHAATQEPAWLEAAAAVAEQLRRRFRAEGGGYHETPIDGEALLVRRMEGYDGAFPSGNSAAAYALQRLWLLTGDPRWQAEADGVLQAFSGQLAEHPTAFTMMLCALDLALGPTQELVVAGGGAQAQAMLRLGRAGYHPRRVTLLAGDAAAKAAPWTKGMGAHGGRATAYLCEGRACKAPVDLEGLRGLLRSP